MFYLSDEAKLNERERWLEKKWNLSVVVKNLPSIFITLIEKITDKSVDVPVGFFDVTTRTENN